MIQVDLPAAFTVGHFFGFLAKNYLKKEPAKFSNRLLGPLNFYLCCGFAPGGLFLLVGWPAWEAMYIKGSAWLQAPFDRPLVAAFYVLFMIVMVVLGNVGFILAHHWYQKGKDKFVVWGWIIGLILTLLPFALRWGVWWKIGTYADIQAGQGYSFWQGPFFWGWLCIMSWLAVTMIAAGIWFKKRGDKL